MTEQTEKRARGTLVEALSSALERGGSGLANAPELLRRLLADESWRSFVTQRGELVEYDHFAEFIVTPPLKGLGTTVALVRRVVSDVPETVDLLDQALQNPVGTNQHSKGLDNIQTQHPSGTSREAGLRRLRKDRPDLHGEVLAGRLSTHAAMVKAGFRRKMVTVPVDTPENTAKALRRNLAPEAVAELARLLTVDN